MFYVFKRLKMTFSLEVVMDGVMYKQVDKEVKVVVVVMNGVMDKQVENEVEKEVNKVVFLGAGNCIFDGKF